MQVHITLSMMMADVKKLLATKMAFSTKLPTHKAI